MRGRHEHLLDEVVLFGAVRRYADAAAVLRAVLGDGDALDISAVRHGDHDVFLVDQILVLDRAVIDGNLRFPLGGIFRLNRKQIVFDDREHARFVRENVL